MLDRTPGGSAGLVLTGEAGVGKTTLWRAGIEDASAVDHFGNHEGAPIPATEQVETTPVKEEQAPVEPAPPEPIAEQQPAPPEPAPAPEPQPAPGPPPPPPDPADEFAPGGSAPAAAGSPTPAARPQPAGGEFTSGGGSGAGGGGGAGEFAP